ncbi:hypothetical protein SFC88_13420 [Nocardioides sp. HM23]|uniref:hypothetical protein n=1 Tax=Nocardioides bizhenqiangii TaxID=3095076 RepID=UPI002AC9F5D1|nr:hypothetical protein [Nocardioides sp. HM23]MDZ5621840.1 hypothetical protein [Nocardioides sp. HM23]
MHKRSIRILGTALAALGLVLPLAGSEAAAAPAVDDADFPTVADVAAIYPFYDGGGRQVVDDPELILVSSDCLHDRVGPTAPSGGYALYWGGDDNPSPLDDGGAEPRVEIYRFNSLSRAHQVLGRIRDNVTRCYGRFAAGERVRVRRGITVPALGSEPPVAWRTRVQNDPDRDEVPDFNTIDIWVRRGRYLVLVEVARITAPGKAPAVSLARAALESIG